MSPLRRRSARERPAYLRLLAGILISYALIIGFGDTGPGDALRMVLFGFLLWTALRLRGLSRYRWWVFGATAVVLVATGWAAYAGSPRLASEVAGACTLVMISAVIVMIASHIVGLGAIDTRSVLGVLCIYLLLALFFAAVHQVLGAWSDPYLHGTASPASASDLLYFSVITMTTVGFGDITPASQVARAVTVTEALAGQLYLVSVVAATVANWRGRSTGRNGARPDQ